MSVLRLAVILMALSAGGVRADSSLFVDFGLGQTLFEVPRDNLVDGRFDDASSSIEAARSLRVSTGLSWGDVLHVGVSGWFWGDSDLLPDKYDEEKADEAAQTEQVTDPSPELWAGGADVFARLILPLGSSGSGPYLEYGRLCWTATVTELDYDWDKSGCSVRRGLGVMFKSSSAMRLAFDRTDFDDIALYQLILNVQLYF